MAKKAKQVFKTPQGSPANSATNTPKKSPVAERIAQEKARLKKLEHELSEKLKREGDRDSALKASGEVLQSITDSSDAKAIEIKEKKPKAGTSCDDTSHHESQGQGFDLRGASGQFIPEATPFKDGKTPTKFALDITNQQLEHVRKLQVNDLVLNVCSD